MVILNENIPNVAAPQDIWTLLRNTIDNKFVIFTVPFFCNHAYLAVFKSNDSNSPCTCRAVTEWTPLFVRSHCITIWQRTHPFISSIASVSRAWNWNHLTSIPPKNSVRKKGWLQCSSPILSSHQGLYWGCCHQINHWELLKIHWSSSAFQLPRLNSLFLHFSLFAPCFNVSFIYHCMHNCR